MRITVFFICLCMYIAFHHFKTYQPVCRHNTLSKPKNLHHHVFHIGLDGPYTNRIHHSIYQWLHSFHQHNLISCYMCIRRGYNCYDLIYVKHLIKYSQHIFLNIQEHRHTCSVHWYSSRACLGSFFIKCFGSSSSSTPRH